MSFINEKATFDKFGNRFQEDLVHIMIDDRVFCDQISEVMDTNFLELKYLRVFVEKLFDYRKKYVAHPSRDTLTTILRTELDKENELLQKQIREFFARVQAKEFSGEGSQHIKDVSLDFCKKQKLKEAMIKSVGLIQNSSYDEVSKIINDALKLGTDNNNGYDFIVDFEKRFEHKARNPVTTNWDLIDKITKGGLGKGELGVVIAPTGVGKSMVLVHLGAAALKAGKNVVHYTLELQDKVVALRYDSCLTGVPISNVVEQKDIIWEGVKDIPGKLLVKEYPTKMATTTTIRNHIEKLKRKDFKVDMIIVDYGDLLRPVSSQKEKRNELESIYEEMRGIAQSYDCPVWTASQTNRSGINAEVITMESISEAFNKCFVADFIFTVSRTIRDKNTNEGRIYVAKNRNGPDGIVFPIFMDTSNVKIKVLSESTETATEIMENAVKRQEDNLKQKYRDYKKQK